MSNLSLNQIERNIAEDNLIVDIRNLFRSKIKDNVINDKRLDKIIIDIITLFETEQKSYYEPARIGNAFSRNCIEYESNGDKEKTLWIEEYLEKIRPYLSNMINDLKMQGELKIQTIAIIFNSSNDTNETRTIHSNSDNMEIMIGN